MKDARICILMMDSLGIGAAADAHKYGDEAANTLGHILDAYPDIHMPNLTRWGLKHALGHSSDQSYIPEHVTPVTKYGYAQETSFGKDTPSGHWELMGVPVLFDWGYFPNTVPCFPEALIKRFCVEAGVPGVLGNCHASGTTIIDDLGAEHIKTGCPIVYTSADSVFQIAAHETYFGLDRLYEVCEIARKLVDEYAIGRVIARPFVGEPGQFKRTANRKDYTTPPYRPTLLELLKNRGHEIIALGKISDIFAHQGISQVIYGEDNNELFEKTLEVMKTAPKGAVVFTNFVDFDSKYGHRRDVPGYAKAIEAFDKNLAILEQYLQPHDVVFVVADHGCDPTLPGSDHTREHIPILMYGQNVKPSYIGCRETFADVGQTIADIFQMPKLPDGESFL